jgi:hypothetical protein
MTDHSEKNESLWILSIAPSIWAVHFMLSYITAALWCGMVVGFGGSLASVRAAIAVYTAVALVGIGITGWIGFRRHAHGMATVPHDFDTPESRRSFLGFATLLLSALSAVGTLYVGLAAVFIGNCY